jgi:hypothetical protein
MTVNKYTTDHDDIAKDIKTRGCPVCNYIWERVLDFFSQWVHGLAENEDIQKQNADAHGLCPFHSWQLVAVGSPLGISKGYGKLIRQIANELHNGSDTQVKATVTLHSLVNGAKECRVCILMQKEESSYISKMSNFLMAEENRRLYNSSGGLCLRHLQNVVMEIKDIEVVRFLMTEAAKHFNAIADEMDSYSLKRKTSQKQLLTKAEKDAHLRGIIHAVGRQHICNQFQ